MVSLACQSASDTKPTATNPSRILPKGSSATVLSAPEKIGALAGRRAPCELQRQPADQKVNNAISDQPDAGEHRQRRAFTGLLSLAVGIGRHRRDPPPLNAATTC